jgi:hypothetical protein
MDAHEVIAPCAMCKTVDLLRPYGVGGAPICLPCARALNEPREPSEAVSQLASDAAEQLKRLT